jgi:NADH:ubiquinone oxidoreductase subunit 6 (subunit J)
MNTSKTVTLTIVGIVAIVIMLLVIQLLLRKLKVKSEQEGRLKTSYGVWFATLFIAATITMGKAITILSEAIDNIYKNISTNIIGKLQKLLLCLLGYRRFGL